MGKNNEIDESSKNRIDILRRLRRIEGQIKGIQKMVEEEKYCVDILTQIAAVRAAINKVGGIILERHSKVCLKKAMNADKKEEVLDELVDTIQKFLKFVD